MQHNVSLGCGYERLGVIRVGEPHLCIVQFEVAKGMLWVGGVGPGECGLVIEVASTGGFGGEIWVEGKCRSPTYHPP